MKWLSLCFVLGPHTFWSVVSGLLLMWAWIWIRLCIPGKDLFKPSIRDSALSIYKRSVTEFAEALSSIPVGLSLYVVVAIEKNTSVIWSKGNAACLILTLYNQFHILSFIGTTEIAAKGYLAGIALYVTISI